MKILSFGHVTLDASTDTPVSTCSSSAMLTSMVLPRTAQTVAKQHRDEHHTQEKTSGSCCTVTYNKSDLSMLPKCKGGGRRTLSWLWVSDGVTVCVSVFIQVWGEVCVSVDVMGWGVVVEGVCGNVVFWWEVSSLVTSQLFYSDHTKRFLRIFWRYINSLLYLE